MTTGGSDRLSCCENTWSHNQTLIDGIAQSDVNTGATQITNCCETGEQCALRIYRRAESNVGFIECKALYRLIFTCLSFKMNMHIDQTGQHRLCAEINQYITRCRLGKACLDGYNFRSLYEQCSLTTHVVRLPINQISTMNNGALCR